MTGFFVRFGKGILYVLVCPLFIVALAIVGAFGLLGFVAIFIKSIFLFFTGRSLKDDLLEDIKAKEILSNIEAKQEALMSSSIAPQTTVNLQDNKQIQEPEVEESLNPYTHDEIRIEQEPPIEQNTINVVEPTKEEEKQNV